MLTVGTDQIDSLFVGDSLVGAVYVGEDKVYPFGSVPFDLTLAVYDGSEFSVGSQDLTPLGVAFNSSGTKMCVLGFANDTVYQYTLATPWNVSTATYDSVSISVQAQDTNPRGLVFSSDGIRMFVGGATTRSVFQYTLSTPFDVSTGSYDSVSFAVGTQDDGINDIAFSQDGTRMFMAGTDNDSVYSYTLSIPWDLSTASYDSLSFSVSAQESAPSGVELSRDGTRMFVVGIGSDAVYQYTLLTPFDLSTASYDELLFSILPQDSEPWGIAFSSDETRMFVAGNVFNKVYQYSMVEPASFDLSIASYDSVLFSVTSQDIGPHEVVFSRDGKRMFVLGIISDKVYQYDLSVSFDVSTASYNSDQLAVGTQESNPQGMAVSADGSKLYVVGSVADAVFQYTLSTPWDVDSASYSGLSFSISAQETVPRGVALSRDGTKMYVTGNSSDSVHQYTLATPWNVSTATYDSSFSVASQETFIMSVAFGSDGEKFYVGGESGTVFQYTPSAPWEISGATYDGVSFSAATQETGLTGVTFDPEGTKMFICGYNSSSVHQYSAVPDEPVGPLTLESTWAQVVNDSITTTIANVVVPSGGGRLIVIGASGTNEAISGVTYDGVACTLHEIAQSDAGGGGRLSALYYLVAPSEGTADVVVTWSAADDNVAFAWVFTGADAGTPLGVTQEAAALTGTSASLSPASEVDDMVVSICTIRQGSAATATGTDQTRNQTGLAGTNIAGAISTQPASSPTTTASWSWTASDDHGVIAVAVHAG